MSSGASSNNAGFSRVKTRGGRLGRRGAELGQNNDYKAPNKKLSMKEYREREKQRRKSRGKTNNTSTSTVTATTKRKNKTTKENSGEHTNNNILTAQPKNRHRTIVDGTTSIGTVGGKINKPQSSSGIAVSSLRANYFEKMLNNLK